MAEWLHAHLPDSAKILVSPATRAQQTARALAEISHRKFKTLDELAPGASADELLAAVRWPDAKPPIVVVGHQPTLGWVASKVLTGEELPWSIKKAAVWWLQSRSRGGEDQAVLRTVVNPDLL
jgi:phosphohistidine phosphatase